ncbi:hypothetical protein [Arthrobacter globiformis]|uniref:hypothetical protein n=1 Tax=Arthrobacter globiformis TaxID=1665 RepID=UPI00279382CC|nr:hypothetical protein [Arthrobacter globiformis]MDQ0619721.1 hypothetical protein [Arthrobacter globiformis]
MHPIFSLAAGATLIAVLAAGSSVPVGDRPAATQDKQAVVQQLGPLAPSPPPIRGSSAGIEASWSGSWP